MRALLFCRCSGFSRAAAAPAGRAVFLIRRQPDPNGPSIPPVPGLDAAGFLLALKRYAGDLFLSGILDGILGYQKIWPVRTLLILPCLGCQNQREPKQTHLEIKGGFKRTDFRKIDTRGMVLRHSAADAAFFLAPPRSESRKPDLSTELAVCT